MTKKDLKSLIIPMLYVIIVVMLVSSIYFMQRILQREDIRNQSGFIYGRDILSKDITPVIANPDDEDLIIKPYINDDVKIVKYFYDEKADITKQQQSLIFHEDTYIQNSGVDYGGAKNFDIVASLGGVVTNIEEDNLLGNIIEIKHTNDLVTIYQSLSEVKVKIGDTVTKGQVIGKSGPSNIDKELEDHLHFEMYYKGQVVDPEKFIGKNKNELE